MRHLNTIFAAAALGLCTLIASPALAQQSGEDRDDIIMVAADDPAMEAAKAEARRQLPDFYRALVNPAEDESDFAIKFNLTPKGNAEFIWAGELEWTDGKFYGVLQNVPNAPDYSEGQRVLIPQKDIIDWGYFKGDVMQGNYTTRVLLDRMQGDEADQVRANFGW